MRVFRTDTLEKPGLAAQIRFKPTGVAAGWSGIQDFTRRKPLGAAGALILLLAILVAIFAGVIAPHDPLKIGVAEKLAAPGAENAPLGTDHLGRDILSRLIHGARVSMFVGVVSVFIGISAGTILGIASAYAGGWADIILQRLVDALMGFPPIILALGLVAALGASTSNVVIALVVVLVPGATRVIRSQALSIKELDYTLAARSIGASSMRIMLRHMLPNVAATYIVLITITLGFAIVVEGVPELPGRWRAAGRGHLGQHAGVGPAAL